jgi:hypothetical protein
MVCQNSNVVASSLIRYAEITARFPSNVDGKFALKLTVANSGSGNTVLTQKIEVSGSQEIRWTLGTQSSSHAPVSALALPRSSPHCITDVVHEDRSRFAHHLLWLWTSEKSASESIENLPNLHSTARMYGK